MPEQTYAVVAIGFLALLGLAASNHLYDRGVPQGISRCVAPAAGGGAFLVAVLLLDARTAILVSGAMTLFIIALRLGFRRGLRGVAADRPTQAWAELIYPLAGTACLAVGWGLLGDKWLAFVPISFMAFGDNVAGLARASIWRGNAASIWPSLAMLAVCLMMAAFFQPYWIGAVGSVVATAVERFRPTAHGLWDDNWVIVAASLATMGFLDVGGG